MVIFKVIIECPRDAPVQRDRPKSMQIQISRLACTNIRELGASRADLAQALHSLQEGSLVFATDFPSKPDDLHVVTDRILSHVAGKSDKLNCFDKVACNIHKHSYCNSIQKLMTHLHF